MNIRKVASIALGLALLSTGCGDPSDSDKSGTGGTSNGSGGGNGSGGSAATGAPPNCAALSIEGAPESSMGATWTYSSTDGGIEYALEGILFVPSGEPPFPAVIVNHGKDGSVFGYSKSIAQVMQGWGMVAIGTMYSHGPDEADSGNLPDGDNGASDANILRARKTLDLLQCVEGVDLQRLAAHGHSMGAFLTAQLVGSYPGDFRAASHTAGGTNTGPFATDPEVAAQITTPYQIHHGDADDTVQLAYDEDLAAILEANAVPHELNVYPGYTHQQMSNDTEMLERVRTWYTTHGVLP